LHTIISTFAKILWKFSTPQAKSLSHVTSGSRLTYRRKYADWDLRSKAVFHQALKFRQRATTVSGSISIFTARARSDIRLRALPRTTPKPCTAERLPFRGKR